MNSTPAASRARRIERSLALVIEVECSVSSALRIVVTLTAEARARSIMGSDEGALIRLWQEKRGEAEPEDFSDNLIVQLGRVTEDLNRQWFECNTGQTIKDVQRRIRHPVNRWMGATLDGLIEATGAVFEAKFMLPWSFSEEGAAEKHMAQLQHNMWVVNAKMAALLIITGGG
jgi:predicted phage-related endonuclease